jgi:hypothetical protein
VSDQGSLFPIGGRRSRGRCRRGFDDTIAAMRGLGRLEKIDSGLVALCRVAADELDAACADPSESRYVRGVLVARYHGVLTHLLARPDTPNDADTLESLFAAVVDDPTLR